MAFGPPASPFGPATTVSAFRQKFFDDFYLAITPASFIQTTVVTVTTTPVVLGPLSADITQRRRRAFVQNTSAVTVTIGNNAGVGYELPPGSNVQLPSGAAGVGPSSLFYGTGPSNQQVTLVELY
jgi:hypothetical protein